MSSDSMFREDVNVFSPVEAAKCQGAPDAVWCLCFPQQVKSFADPAVRAARYC